MSSLDFVHFMNPGEGLRTRTYDGYLSFLAAPQYQARNPVVGHRCFAHESLYIFELKDELQQEASRIELTPQAPCLWIVTALIGDCTIQADGMPMVASGSSVCFASTSRTLTMALVKQPVSSLSL